MKDYDFYVESFQSFCQNAVNKHVPETFFQENLSGHDRLTILKGKLPIVMSQFTIAANSLLQEAVTAGIDENKLSNQFIVIVKEITNKICI